LVEDYHRGKVDALVWTLRLLGKCTTLDEAKQKIAEAFQKLNVASPIE